MNRERYNRASFEFRFAVMSHDLWFAFLLACGAISISPGAGAVASMTSGLRNGVPRGLVTAIGQQFGLALQIVVVGIGVGAAIATSPLAFELVRWGGVVYLAWLGIRQWCAGDRLEGLADNRAMAQSGGAMVLRGFLVNASNPKATVFMLAVLPQFIDPSMALAPQYLVLAATMIGVDIVVMAGYTGLAAQLARFWREPRHLAMANRVLGLLFVAAAVLLAAYRPGG